MGAPAETTYMGGQAVLEGVMMRGPEHWAVAVRLPDGEIVTQVNELPVHTAAWRRWPLVRGVMSLGGSLALGYRALSWSANRQLEAETGEDAEPMSERAIGITMGVAMVIFAGLFLVLPALAGRALSHSIDAVPFQVVEAIVRITFFVGYLLLIARMRDIRRVFEYHGAEHKAIAAYENGVELTPEAAQRFTTAHVRCGTNFLLTVMVVAILCYSVVPTPNLAAIVASRVVLIPVIAGLSFELIRLAAGHMDRAVVRALMAPGLWLQRLTTRPPSLDQIEVAIDALRASMTAGQLAEVDARVPTAVAITR